MNNELLIILTDDAEELCSRCGFKGHKAEECEYPFPQGHKYKQKQQQDWSLLNGQIIGGEFWNI